MEFQTALGQIVRERREQAGLTQSQLGELAGYAGGAAVSISRVERGLVGVSDDRLADIASALGMAAFELKGAALVRSRGGIATGPGQAESKDRADGPARGLSVRQRLQRAEETANRRIEVVRERGDKFYRAQESARERFFLPFVAAADGLEGAVVLPAPDVAHGGADALTADQRIRLTGSRISQALLGGVGGLAAGAGAGGAAAFATFTVAASVGTASTGTAISALAGVAATNATMAFLGGGALAAGGAGMLGGTLVLTGIVAAPALVLAGAGFALYRRKSQQKMAETADQVEEALKSSEPSFEALVRYLEAAAAVLDYIQVHATHALLRWQRELPPRADPAAKLAWDDLSDGQKNAYEDFVTVAACQVAVLSINPEAFMAAPQQPEPQEDPEASNTATDDAEPTFNQMTSLEELIRYSEETLRQARTTVEALV